MKREGTGNEEKWEACGKKKKKKKGAKKAAVTNNLIKSTFIT